MNKDKLKARHRKKYIKDIAEFVRLDLELGTPLIKMHQILNERVLKEDYEMAEGMKQGITNFNKDGAISEYQTVIKF